MLIQRRPVPILSPFTSKMTIFIILGFNYASGVSLGKCKKKMYLNILIYTLIYIFLIYTPHKKITYCTLCFVKVFDDPYFF